jgi:hypothetical protein
MAYIKKFLMIKNLYFPQFGCLKMYNNEGNPLNQQSYKYGSELYIHGMTNIL